MKPVPIIIAGPSGVGKSTIIKAIAAQIKEIETYKTITTRQPRASEEDRYIFVDANNFHELIKKGALIEWAEVHGNFYGAAKKDVLEIIDRGNFPMPVNAVDVQGVATYKKIFPGLVSIFISYGSLSELPARIRATRPDATDEDVQTRLISAQKEMEAARNFDYVVENPEERLDETIEKVRNIIVKKIRG